MILREGQLYGRGFYTDMLVLFCSHRGNYPEWYQRRARQEWDRDFTKFLMWMSGRNEHPHPANPEGE